MPRLDKSFKLVSIYVSTDMDWSIAPFPLSGLHDDFHRSRFTLRCPAFPLRLCGQNDSGTFPEEGTRSREKEDQSPVTIADREAETWLRQEIRGQFSEDAVLGEEFGETPGSNDFRWILDPIDGTKSFISGVPLYGTMVGLEFRGEAVMGGVYLPGLDEGIYAAQGQGC